MATKQDKRVKREKQAKADAEVIVKAAKKKVATKPVPAPSSAVTVEYPEAWNAERVESATDQSQWVLSVQARLLREEGEPWWAIARALELEGAGDSATTGKKGAARARNVYKYGFGSFPRTFKTGGYKGKAETNERVRELAKQKKAERKAQARAGKSVLDPEMPDEELAEMIRGRRIRWFSTLLVPEGIDQEACVHPRAPMYIYEDFDGHKVVEFREQHRKAPPGVREIPAQIRVVRVSAIYNVK